MGNYNKVLLMGNLTRDIETRQAGQSTVANIGLAVNRRFKKSDGGQGDETTFVDCEAWGKTAETMAQYLRKGRPVFIEGRLKLDQWQDKDGGNRSKLKVVVESFQFVDSNGGGKDASEPATTPATVGKGKIGGAYDSVSEDDIPF